MTKRLKRAIREAKFEVIDHGDFFNSLQELYLKPSIEQVIAEELPLILAQDPQFFLRNQIYLGNVTESLGRLYGEGSAMYQKVGDQALGDATHSFKVLLRHVRFFMIDHPDQSELQKQVDEIKEILKGEYCDEFRTRERDVSEVIQRVTLMSINSVPFPNILEIRETDYPYFESVEGIYTVVSKALPFVKEPEARRIAVKINSRAGTLSEKALFAKASIESYLNEARSYVADKAKPIPDYYDTNSTVYNTIIKPARDAILL